MRGSSTLYDWSASLLRRRGFLFVGALEAGLGAGVPEEEGHPSEDEEDDEGEKEAEEAAHERESSGEGRGRQC